MDSTHLSGYDKAVTRMYAEEMIASFREQMRDAENLADELNDVLANYAANLGNEKEPKTFNSAETLDRWVRHYRDALSAADRLFHNGDVLLRSLENHPSLKAKQMDNEYEKALGRLENEGGPACKDGDILRKDLTKVT